MSFLTQVKTSREHFITQAAASSNPEISRIAGAVKEGRSNLADFAAYSIVNASGRTMVRFFESQDAEGIGVKNIATGRLEKGEIFMCTAVQLLAASSVADATTGLPAFDADHISTLAFGAITGNLVNAEWRLDVNNKIIVPRTSAQVFATDGWNVPTGLYPLVNPKIFEDKVPLNFEVETKTAIADRTALKLVLYGTVAVPA